jgi:hypothetical protein
MVVAARKALFLVNGGQLTRSRFPQAIRIDASKSATKVVRQIMLTPLVALTVLAGLRRVPTKQVFRRQVPSRQ